METAYYESKSKEISIIYCTDYDAMEATERRMVWNMYIMRSQLPIVNGGMIR